MVKATNKFSGTIYVITNLINNKKYIGQTKNSKEQRFEKHSISKYPIGFAIRKYGKENFFTVAIDIALNQEELDKKEIYWIEKLNTLTSGHGYNISTGGNGGMYGKDGMEESHKRKISEALKGKPKKYASWNKGKEWNQNIKRKISDSLVNNEKVKGENNGNAKITEEQARLIKTLFSQGKKASEISKLLDIKNYIIYNVIHNRLWKHI